MQLMQLMNYTPPHLARSSLFSLLMQLMNYTLYFAQKPKNKNSCRSGQERFPGVPLSHVSCVKAEAKGHVPQD